MAALQKKVVLIDNQNWSFQEHFCPTVSCPSQCNELMPDSHLLYYIISVTLLFIVILIKNFPHLCLSLAATPFPPLGNKDFLISLSYLLLIKKNKTLNYVIALTSLATARFTKRRVNSRRYGGFADELSQFSKQALWIHSIRCWGSFTTIPLLLVQNKKKSAYSATFPSSSDPLSELL